MSDHTPKPSAKQLEFLSWEFGLFFHFGIRTFHPGHKDWDMRPMSLDAFDPEIIDCDEWVRTAKEAGAKYTIMTAKHHDGFANWPTKFSEFSVKNVPWKNGAGDVVKDYTEACRKYGIKCGIYYSPADFNSRNDTMTGKEFEDYFIAQISELLKNYGKIDYLWFDGCGSENMVLSKGRIVKAIRSLQPDILIFNMWDPDVRWIGNEEGFAPLFNTNVVDCVDFSVLTEEKDRLNKKMFLPAECDMRMRATHWFTASDEELDTVKSVEQLMEVYNCSVGRGANMLLNIGPAATGRLPEKDKARLMEFAEALKKRFDSPIIDSKLPENGAVRLDRPQDISLVVLCEDLTEGECVHEFELLCDGVTVYKGGTIGHKCICSFDNITASEISVKVTKSVGEYKLARIAAYRDEA